MKSDPDVRPVLIYADSLGNRGGTGVYMRRLLTGLSRSGACVLAAIGGSFTIPRMALETLPSSGIVKVIRENLMIPLRASSISPGIIHLPAFSGRGIGGVPCAVTVHDLAFCRNPSWFSPLRSVYYRVHFRRVASVASVVMVDSDFTASEAGSLLGIESDRLRRVYLSTEPFEGDPEEFRRACGVKGRYIVFTGTVEPRKNLEALLAAWPGVSMEHPDLTLVIAGRWGRGSSKLRKMLKGTPGVVHTGRLSCRVLKSCVSGASLMVYPSLYEGFGLPPLEAASAGVPSVVTPAEALKEIYGKVSMVAGGFGADHIEKAVLDALDISFDPGLLKDFASGFSVDRMTEDVLEVYREFRE